jgi:hypothetical protein
MNQDYFSDYALLSFSYDLILVNEIDIFAIRRKYFRLLISEFLRIYEDYLNFTATIVGSIYSVFFCMFVCCIYFLRRIGCLEIKEILTFVF